MANMTHPDVAQSLNNLLPADFSRRISIIDGCDNFPLPDWAATLVWLGAWCRLNRLAGNRLIVFAVLPSRDLAAAFAGFGCLVAGASNFEDALSWPTFKKLPAGRGVFWRKGIKRYCGNIVGFKEYGGSEFIIVQVTKAPKRAEVGSSCEISRAYFNDYRFTEEEPPSVSRTASFDVVGQSLRPLIDNLNPKWIWADGAEGLLVTSVSTSESEIAAISLSIDKQAPISITDLLCLARNKGQSHAKLRIDHPRGTLDGNFPLAILDGAKAFMVHEHLAAVSNMLVILDRSEFNEDIHDAVLRLRGISIVEKNADLQGVMPSHFIHGIELSAYWIGDGNG